MWTLENHLKVIGGNNLLFGVTINSFFSFFPVVGKAAQYPKLWNWKLFTVVLNIPKSSFTSNRMKSETFAVNYLFYLVFFVFQYPKRKMACMYRIYRRAKRASVLCYFFVTVKFFHNFMWNVFSAPFWLEASRSYNTIQYINQKEINVQSARSAPRITASGNINW